MILPLTIDPNPILHQVGKKLTAKEINSPQIQELILNMIDTLYAADGVGLAAPQVGESIQLCVIGKNYTNDQKEDLALINPEWQKASILKAWDLEGCLSVPKTWGEVRRFKKVRVQALNKHGSPIQFIAADLFARIVQHEVDHLQGHLFVEKAKRVRVVDARNT